MTEFLEELVAEGVKIVFAELVKTLAQQFAQQFIEECTKSFEAQKPN